MAALQTCHSIKTDENLLIAVVLLTVLDLLESGSGAWSFHLEGVKNLLQYGNATGIEDWDSTPSHLLRDVAV